MIEPLWEVVFRFPENEMRTMDGPVHMTEQAPEGGPGEGCQGTGPLAGCQLTALN